MDNPRFKLPEPTEPSRFAKGTYVVLGLCALAVVVMLTIKFGMWLFS
jgi:hypothetical protein